MTGQDSLRKYIQAETRKMYGKEESGRKSLPQQTALSARAWAV